MNLTLDEILQKIPDMENKSSESTLVYHSPDEDDLDFYIELCEFFRNSDDLSQQKVFDCLSEKKGILNTLLGMIFESAENLKKEKDVFWLKTGLTAAEINGNRLDPRDFLLALAELYVSAIKAGINPDSFFDAAKKAVPKNFKDYPVVKNRVGG
ncbi:hypothetical protein JXA84_02485 [candidate division WOR-3 bacterium]|nr:hypothetical protein [candidate division WOR-3 bacterium]